MERNILLLQGILPLYRAWFWLGIWLPFYLRITDYAGIGLLESSMFLIGFLIEIPTGAISDMFGKKRTLIVAYFFYGLGNLFMALSDSYTSLFLSVFIMVIGSALYSGTAEAIVYDSAKSLSLESDYEKILSNISKYKLLLMSFVSFIGGYLYFIDIRLPFFATSAIGFFGMILIVFFVKEPPIDTEKFSIKNYIEQNRQGIRQFTKIPKPNLKIVLFVLMILSVANILDQVLDTAYAVELGYDSVQLGILFGVLPLLGALGAQLYPRIINLTNKFSLLLLGSIIFLISMLLAPSIGLILGTIMIGIRSFLQPMFEVLGSNEINQKVDSKYRAITISTFEMIKQLPYILIAYVLGSLVDTYSAINIVFLIGLIACVILSPFFLITNRKNIF